MNVADNPCTSCPYRKDTPAGVWHRDEYEKLRGYDDPQTAFSLFLCHHSPFKGETVCRGWLTVHAESIAARLATAQGNVTNQQRYASVSTPLYATGNEAADAGEAGIVKPNSQACDMVRKLARRRKSRRAIR